MIIVPKPQEKKYGGNMTKYEGRMKKYEGNFAHIAVDWSGYLPGKREVAGSNPTQRS